MKNIFETLNNENGEEKKVYTGMYQRTPRGIFKPFKRRVLGWDPAFKIDYAGVAVVDQCLDRVYRVIGVTQWKKMDWIEQYRNLEYLVGLLDIDEFVYDANGPGNTCESTFKEVNPDGTPRYPNISNIQLTPVYSHHKNFKLTVYGEMKKLMTQHRLKLPISYSGLDDQFAALNINEKGTISHKKGTFIDIPSAIMMAMSTFLTKKYTKQKQVNKIFFIE